MTKVFDFSAITLEEIDSLKIGDIVKVIDYTQESLAYTYQTIDSIMVEGPLDRLQQRKHIYLQFTENYVVNCYVINLCIEKNARFDINPTRFLPSLSN